MPEESDKIIDENKDENKDVEKEPELTLESLKEIVTSQAGLMEALKTESANSTTQITQALQGIQEKYGLMEGDMQNLTNLLGGLANKDTDPDDGEGDDVTTEEGVNRVYDKREQAKLDAEKKETKAYWKEYGEIAQEFMEEDGPDGKPLSKEAREGIKKLMIDTPADKTKNATRDAQRGFRKASRIFFGLDRTHGFKGSSTEGTGGGGSEVRGGTKKTYKLTDESKQLVKDFGETEEWAQEQLRKRAEEQLV